MFTKITLNHLKPIKCDDKMLAEVGDRKPVIDGVIQISLGARSDSDHSLVKNLGNFRNRVR